MKAKWKIAAAALCAAVLLTGVFAAAAGSEGDPLVTLSYLKNVFTGQIQTMVEQSVTAAQEQNEADLEAAISAWDEKVSQAIENVTEAPAAEEPASFLSAALAEGKSLSFSAGCELIVRSGAPVCSVELLDQTDGTVLAAGSAMAVNHLYYATGEGKLSTPAAVITGVVNAGPLNVRAGAGTGYERLGSLNKDTAVTVLDKSISGWYMISGGGLSGYVSADYIDLDPAGGSGPAALLIRGDYAM